MSRFLRSRRTGIATAVALLSIPGMLLGVAVPAAASPAATAPKGLDHFLCYTASPPTAGGGFPIPAGVTLQNQFNSSGFQPQAAPPPLLHCNPVQKTVPAGVFPILHKNAHEVCLPITAPTQPAFKVQVTNQFGRAKLVTGQPQALCLPTWKKITGPPNKTPNQPPGVDHFTCYPVQYIPGTPPFQPPSPISLQDQFTTQPVRVNVGNPVSLCVPTTKILSTGVVFQAKKPKAHLLCFQVTPTPMVPQLFDQNQFGTSQLQIQQTAVLCLPSLKKIIP